jgi:hypothetical protein
MNERETIHEQFWKLTDIERNQYYSTFVERKLKSRKRTNNGYDVKKYSFKYFLEIRGERISVCKVFFFNTLDVGEKVIYEHFKNVYNSAETARSSSTLNGKQRQSRLDSKDDTLLLRHHQNTSLLCSELTLLSRRLEKELSRSRKYDALYSEKGRQTLKYRKRMCDVCKRSVVILKVIVED